MEFAYKGLVDQGLPYLLAPNIKINLFYYPIISDLKDSGHIEMFFLILKQVSEVYFWWRVPDQLEGRHSAARTDT